MGPAGARDAISRGLRESALELFRRLPSTVRRQVTHRVAPTYSVGAVAVCEDAEGRVLLVRSRQQRAWSLPGGLLKRHEAPAAAVARELAEELGVVADEEELGQTPRVVVDPDARQVTVVYRLTLRHAPVRDGVEVVEVGWFHCSTLPSALLRGTRESIGFFSSLDR